VVEYEKAVAMIMRIKLMTSKKKFIVTLHKSPYPFKEKTYYALIPMKSANLAHILICAAPGRRMVVTLLGSKPDSFLCNNIIDEYWDDIPISVRDAFILNMNIIRDI